MGGWQVVYVGKRREREREREREMHPPSKTYGDGAGVSFLISSHFCLSIYPKLRFMHCNAARHVVCLKKKRKKKNLVLILLLHRDKFLTCLLIQ